MTLHVNCIVVGAGVVGLAVARALARLGRDVVVLEREDCIGSGTSSRNSEVIHAGIYYPQDSLKARACINGRRLLYAYAMARGIPHAKCGKLIVASNSAQLDLLDGIAKKAAANGVENMQQLDAADALAMEPDLSITGALHSPETGIIDSHALMLSLQGDLEDAGGMIAFNTPVTAIDVSRAPHRVVTAGDDPATITCDTLVNAAGLGAPRLAANITGLPDRAIPKAYFAKGNYFRHEGRVPFSRLIYPVPEPGGLGVHVTIDLGGQARFGPDVEWPKDPTQPCALAVDPTRADRFYDAIRSYWPALCDGALKPDYAGIRPKLSGPGETAADFRIDGPAAHGIAGLVNLFGIESPGLTSCLALADECLSALGMRPNR